MIDYLKKIGNQIVSFFTELSPVKRVALIGTLMAIFAIIGAMFFWAGSKTYRPLMTNLTPEDSANIMRVLRAKKIPFRVDPSGKSIEIPPENIFDLRLELATMGLPESSVVGYEVFDKQSLGTTSFVQRVNRQRALEGELIRTINTIKGVKRSRVHLVLPKKSAFIEDQEKPSASVVVDLEPGARLFEKQIFGVGRLVSSAVEGLEPEDVVVVDATGKILSKNAHDPLVAMSATQLDFRRKVEEYFENQITGLLEPIIGEGHVIAKVTAELDFSRLSETQTLYDGDSSAVRSVQKDDHSMAGRRPGPYGVAGVKSNIPGEQPAANNETRTDTKKAKEIVNYAVPKTVRSLTKEFGGLKKLSVAVVVDGKKKSTQKDGRAVSSTEPWPEGKIKEFETLISRAIGLDVKRGDKLEVKNIIFSRADFATAEKLIEASEKRSYVQNVIIYSVIGLLIALFFIFVVRPFIKWVTENTIESVDTFLPQTIEELERLQTNKSLPGLEESVPELPEKIDPDKVEGEMIKEKIVTLIDGNPHKAALILREWLRGQGPKREEEQTA